MCQNVILCTVLKANSSFDVLLATKGCCGQKTCKQGVIQQLRGPNFTQFWPPTLLECTYNYGHFTNFLPSVLYSGSFNNYVDQISPNFDPIPPRVSKKGQFAYFLLIVTRTHIDFLLTPTPLFLSTDVVIEWPLLFLQNRRTATPAFIFFTIIK